MCDPLTIAGAALTAGSVAANTVAQNKVNSARNDAMSAERIRQQGLDREADALNLQSQNRYQNFAEKQDDRSQQLGDYFRDQKAGAAVPGGDANTAAVVPQTASNIVVNEGAKQGAKARAFTDNVGDALGRLRGFGDLFGETSRLQGRDARTIGQIGGFKRGSSDVLSYELDAANKVGDGMKTIGDVLGGLGNISTTAGLSGGSLFGIGSTGKAASNVVNKAASTSKLPTFTQYGRMFGVV